MLKTRVIPCLLLQNEGLVKTINFKKPNYIGDPINAVKIFNEKEVDELVFLDIEATRQKKRPNFDLIKQIATECFMPFAYGGGIRCIEDVKKILQSGAEKVIINSYAYENPEFIKELSQTFGSQSIIISIDYKKNLFGKLLCYINSGRQKTEYSPLYFSKLMQEKGAGEIILTSISHEGKMRGYDIYMATKISASLDIPVVINGGAGSLDDIVEVVKTTDISAVAAGSIFVYNGINRAVLIRYFDRKLLETKLKL